MSWTKLDKVVNRLRIPCLVCATREREGARAHRWWGHFPVTGAFAFVHAEARYLIWQVQVCRLRIEKVLHKYIML